MISHMVSDIFISRYKKTMSISFKGCAEFKALAGTLESYRLGGRG